MAERLVWNKIYNQEDTQQNVLQYKRSIARRTNINIYFRNLEKWTYILHS